MVARVTVDMVDLYGAFICDRMLHVPPTFLALAPALREQPAPNVARYPPYTPTWLLASQPSFYVFLIRMFVVVFF
jgi:hypothetical protein